MKKLLLAVILLISFESFAQPETGKFIKAYPIIGWDSLRSIIERPENYPEIYKRAGVTGSVYVALSIDSTGKLVKVEPPFSHYSAPDSLKFNLFIPAIKNMLDSIKWHPSYNNDKPINDKIYRSFNFLLIDKKEKGFNILAPKFYQVKRSKP